MYIPHITNFQHVPEPTDQQMLIARELPALVQTVQWTVQHHLDVFYLSHHQFQNIQVIQKLEDHIKQLVISLTLIKYQCQPLIQDKILTISLKQLQPQMENQKKFQFLILQFAKLILHSTDKRINKNQLKKKEPQLKENQRKFQFLIPQFANLIQHSTDNKLKNQLKKKEHQLKENQKKFQFLIPQLLRHIPHSTDKLTNRNDHSINICMN